MAVCKLPFKVAVTLTLWFVVRVPAVAMKVAELDPADTATDAGMVSRALLSDNVTVVLEETAWFRLAVQEVEAPEATVPGLQLNHVRLSGTPLMLMVPPAPVVGIALPAAEAPSAFVTLMAVPDDAADNVTVRAATTPFWMTFPFSPVRRHI